MGSFRNSLAWVDRMVEAGLEDLGTDCWADQLAPCSLGFRRNSHQLTWYRAASATATALGAYGRKKGAENHASDDHYNDTSSAAAVSIMRI